MIASATLIHIYNTKIIYKNSKLQSTWLKENSDDADDDDEEERKIFSFEMNTSKKFQLHAVLHFYCINYSFIIWKNKR